MTRNEQILQATFPDILGQATAKEALQSALLAQRNIIFVGPPGVGKTTLARSVATVMQDAPFVRVQGSPDLTVEDLLGDIDPLKALEFGPLSEEAFTRGKIFKADKGILFFDEVNRCTEKLQNALLQVLEEKKVTIGSYDVDFDLDFVFIGTMNPEDSSTEALSDVFLDRFDLVVIDYPETADIEEQIVTSRQQAIEGVTFPETLKQQIIAFIRELRIDQNLERKPGVRASIGVIDRALTTAKIRGKSVVDVQDVMTVLPSVLAHRMRLKPSLKYLQQPEEYIMKQFTAFERDHDLSGGDP